MRTETAVAYWRSYPGICRRDWAQSWETSVCRL